MFAEQMSQCQDIQKEMLAPYFGEHCSLIDLEWIMKQSV